MSSLRAVVLVEGNSDRVALRTLAERQGRDLEAEGVEVVAMGGITNTRAFATRYGPAGLDVPLAGLYDVGEEAILRRGLAAAGLAVATDPDGPRRLGFHACSADLEDELIRALGVEAVEDVVAAAGEAQSLRLLTEDAGAAGLDPRGRPPAVPRVAVRAQGSLRGADGRRPGPGAGTGTSDRRARPGRPTARSLRVG